MKSHGGGSYWTFRRGVVRPHARRQPCTAQFLPTRNLTSLCLKKPLAAACGANASAAISLSRRSSRTRRSVLRSSKGSSATTCRAGRLESSGAPSSAHMRLPLGSTPTRSRRNSSNGFPIPPRCLLSSLPRVPRRQRFPVRREREVGASRHRSSRSPSECRDGSPSGSRQSSVVGLGHKPPPGHRHRRESKPVIASARRY